MKKTQRVVLIDADTVIYRAAVTNQHAIQWDPAEPDLWTVHGNFDAARVQLDDDIKQILGELEGGHVICALSDYNDPWRKRVLPSYKANRKATLKPILLKPLREYVHEQYETFQRPGLEGDDILGILMTRQFALVEERICVSIDKDMRTIPGLHYNCDKPDQGIIQVTDFAADRWHMTQTLTGDTVDGYAGCPGVGPVKAEKILGDLTTAEEMWPAVVAAYEKAGLSEEVALRQAQVARICRASDYDFKKREVKLWSPSK